MGFDWTFLQTFKENFRWADFFDIAIISVFFYSVIIWFKQAASRSILIGVSVVTFVYFLAHTFNLYLTSLLFQAIFAVLLIALVVVFQEDIRRVFERIALFGTFRERRRNLASSSMIDSLIESLSTLASEKVGALVVIKGREPLERHTQGGIPLYGRISQPLLASIFDPHSTGHDGAILIEGERITKFGAHLPLSTNLKQTRARGTRHTAALGLSEESDALILVVSEEQGTISVARNGKLHSIDSAAELKDRLESFYREKFQKLSGRFGRGFFKQDARLKVASLVLATLTWFLFAYQAETLQRTFVVPVEYRNLPPDWLIESDKPSEVHVTLSGSERAFNLLKPANLMLSLDLSSILEGSQRFILTKDKLRSPTNLSFSKVDPNVVLLEAHRVVARTLPIEVQVEGRLSRRLGLVSMQPTPSSIQVQVWKSREEQTSRILTEPIDLSDIKYSQAVETKLIIPEYVHLMETVPPEVHVSITVSSESG